MDEKEVPRIKPPLPLPVQRLDIVDALLQNAQTAVLLLNYCFSKEGCSAGKCLGRQHVGSLHSTSLSSQATAVASSLPTSLFFFFFHPSGQFALTQVRRRMLPTPVHREGFISTYSSRCLLINRANSPKLHMDANSVLLRCPRTSIALNEKYHNMIRVCMK